jgi:hypothetical protein
MSDIEIDSIKYRIAKMSVFDQAHVARKIAPVVFSLGKGYVTAQGRVTSTAATNGSGNGVDDDEVVPNPPDPEELAQQGSIFFDALAPIADVLSAMEEKDVDYVLKKCLSVVSRHNGQHYVALMRSGNLMFDDTDLATIMQLTMEVVQDNLGPSLRALLPLASVGGVMTSQ